jgi:hypothetical protein
MSAHIRFLLAISLLFVVVVAGTYGLTSTQLFCRHSQYQWDAVDCQKFSIKGQSSDVVFVGDSALVEGVRPNIIEENTNISSINLGLPAGAYAFAPDLLLKHYLHQNQRPQLLVLYISPWVRPGETEDKDLVWYEAAGLLLRHASIDEIARFFLEDPRRLVQFSALALRQIATQTSWSGAWWHQASREMRNEHGYLANWRLDRSEPEPKRLKDGCVLEPRAVMPARDYIERFRQAYGRDGTKVAVYVAPVPACDRSYPAIVAAYQGLADNRPGTLPSEYFVDDTYRVHLTLAGAEQATAAISDFIRPLVASRVSEVPGPKNATNLPAAPFSDRFN